MGEHLENKKLEEEIKDLEKEKLAVYSRLRSSYKKVKAVREVLNECLASYNKFNEEYMKIDYKLAMLDGRYQKIPTKKPTKPKGNLLDDLSKESILGIVNVLETKLKKKGGEMK